MKVISTFSINYASACVNENQVHVSSKQEYKNFLVLMITQKCKS